MFSFLIGNSSCQYRLLLLSLNMRRYTTPSVLVIDEVGYTKLSPAQAHHFFELVTARYEHGSILLTSNTVFSDWGNLLGDARLGNRPGGSSAPPCGGDGDERKQLSHAQIVVGTVPPSAKAQGGQKEVGAA